MSKTFKKTAKIKSKSLQSRIWFGFDCKYKADKAFSSLTRISGWILLESYGLSETDIWINVLICCVEPERLMSTCSVSERWFVNSLHFMLDHFIAKFDRKYKMQSEWQKCNFSKKTDLISAVKWIALWWIKAVSRRLTVDEKFETFQLSLKQALRSNFNCFKNDVISRVIRLDTRTIILFKPFSFKNEM